MAAFAKSSWPPEYILPGCWAHEQAIIA